MDVNFQLVRVYGSKYWFGPKMRSDPFKGPLSVTGYPEPGYEAKLYIGDFPDTLYYHANLVSLALNLTPWQSGELSIDQDVIENFLRNEETNPQWGLKFPVTDWSCYVTLSTNHSIDVKDEFFVDQRYGWIEYEEARRLTREELEFCQCYFDSFAALASVPLGQEFFTEVVHEGVYLDVPGRSDLSRFCFRESWIGTPSIITGKDTKLIDTAAIAGLPNSLIDLTKSNDDTLLAIAKVSRLRRRNQDWVNLYRIYEIVKDDLGSDHEIANKTSASANQLTLFSRSANHEKASGDDARHGVSSENEQPPPKPMSLPEAINLVTELVNDWLEIKIQR